MLLLKRLSYLPDDRAHGVADVIEARGIHDGRVSLRTGLSSALISGISLGVGASAGREGPAVHLGASIASLIARSLGYPAPAAKMFLACGAAAAVSASFNAPIAGVLFALEVVLGHYALSVFAPIVIASVAATVVTRIHTGEFPAFIVPQMDFGSYLQLPAFAILGLVAGVVAILFMKSAAMAARVADGMSSKLRAPIWIRPMVGGVMIGTLAIWFPQILGVGYEATDAALKGIFPLSLLVALIAAKIAATSVTLACRFGGGVFSPALYLGAMTGAAFGSIAITLFPELSTSANFYSIVGMGAVSAAILGAPISTALIVFELVREYEAAIALLVSISIATVLTQSVLGRSFFHWQIEMRGYKLQEGPHHALLETIRVSDVMSDTEVRAEEYTGDGPRLTPADRLTTIFELMDKFETDVIPVTQSEHDNKIVGIVLRSDSLAVYNRALVQAHVESHV